MRELACANKDKMPSVGGTERLEEGLAREVPRSFDHNSFVLLRNLKKILRILPHIENILRSAHSSNDYEIPWLRDNLHRHWLSRWYYRILRCNNRFFRNSCSNRSVFLVNSYHSDICLIGHLISPSATWKRNTISFLKSSLLVMFRLLEVAITFNS